MATFELPKSLDEIQEQELLPEDWYVMRLKEEPKLEPSKKKKADPSDPDGRMNLVLRLKVVHDNPQWNGRGFTKWLAMPNEKDRTEMIEATGQLKEDFFMQRIAEVLGAFGHEVDGKSIEINAGDEAQFYVSQQPSFDGSRVINVLADENPIPVD